MFEKALGFLRGVICIKSTCRIEEINIPKRSFTIYFQGTRTTINLTLEEVIARSHIIQGLPPKEACILGICYGRLLKQKIIKSAENIEFLLKNERGKYKIIYQDHRSEKLCYVDQKTKKEFQEHPIILAKANPIIADFDSSQACYIGILAGISFEKNFNHDKKTGENNLEKMLGKHPQLRIVK